MGAGINIGCKCYSKLYMLGIGMMFPDEYKKTVEIIKTGKYGKEAENIMRTIKYAVVDIEDSLYLCEKCGNLIQARQWIIMRQKMKINLIPTGKILKETGWLPPK